MKTNQSVKLTATIFASIVILLLLGFAIYSVISPMQQVSVTGVSSVKVTPDVVSIYFNVLTEGDSASQVKDDNAEIVDDVITALVVSGIDRDDITTEYFNIYQDYDWINGNQQYKGYVASHTLRVELTDGDMELAGTVIDAGVDAGAGINYINFELSQTTQNQYKTLALEQATQDARAKAEGIAQGLGKRLGRIISVSSSEFGYSPWILYDSAGAAEGSVDAAKAATNIQPGEQEISGYVSVAYALR